VALRFNIKFDAETYIFINYNDLFSVSANILRVTGCSAALGVDDLNTGLFVLVLGDPLGLEGGKGAEG